MIFSGCIPNLGSFLEISLTPQFLSCPHRDMKRAFQVVEWVVHSTNNPVLENPSTGMVTLQGFFWFVGIPLLKNPIPNLTIMVHKPWKATVAAIENPQKSIDSLAAVVLQNRRALELLTAAQGGTCAILNETCCLLVNTTRKVEENLKGLSSMLITISGNSIFFINSTKLYIL
jgi:hypothetical protein